MKNGRWIPVLGMLVVIGASGCTPADETAEPGGAPASASGDADATAGTHPDTTAEVADDAATAGATQALARASFTGAPDSGISGTVEVTERTGGVAIVVHVTGVKAAGPLGIHLHEGGVCTPPDFESAGEHFNPGAAAHACSPTSPRHAGDLGNIEISGTGEGRLELETDLLTVVEGPSSVVGRAIVLHDGKDDCATQPSGDSGNRLACGVFERVTQ